MLINAIKAYLVAGGTLVIAALTYALIKIDPLDDIPESSHRDDHGPRKS